jgi:tRNA(Ile)-lysidine synthase
VPLGRARAAQINELAADPEGGEIELGGGVTAICEAGRVRFTAGDATATDDLRPARMLVPGAARFGDWELRAEVCEGPVEPVGPDVATLDAGALGPEVEVRAWRDGDRMRPLGLGGSKSLQDLFTDAGIPRSERGSIPVVVAGDEIAWVAGVAVAEPFRIGAATRRAAVLTVRAREGAELAASIRAE